VGIDCRDEALDQRVRGRGRHIDDGYPFVGQAIDLPPDAVKLSIRRHDPRALQKWERRQPSRHELVRVLSEGDVPAIVADKPGESSPHRRRLNGRAIPFLVHELCRVEPRALLRFESGVGPRLMRVTRQQQAFSNSKA
jgi:hypothetical protein